MPQQTASHIPFGLIAQQMSRMLDQKQKGSFAFSPAETWTPSVNLYETTTHYIVCVDLAGVDKDKIEVTVTEQQLKLRGARPVPSHAEAEHHATPTRYRVHLMEIDHGPFCREVELPQNVDRQRIRASYRNGMLWIELPKN